MIVEGRSARRGRVQVHAAPWWAADRAVASRLDPQREAEDLDEAHGARVVEGVALVVGRQVLVVQRERRAPPVDRGGTVIEADPDVAGDRPIGARDVAAQVAVEGAEPQAVVGELGDLVGDDAVEAERVLGEDEALQRAVRGVEDRRRGRLVDLAALDADQAVLDVVDPAHAVRAAELVEPLDEGDRVQALAVDRDRHAALEADDDLHGRRALRRVDGPGDRRRPAARPRDPPGCRSRRSGPTC